jgi:hypothetical protein
MTSSAVLHRVSRGRMMACHKANSIQVAHDADASSANHAALTVLARDRIEE